MQSENMGNVAEHWQQCSSCTPAQPNVKVISVTVTVTVTDQLCLFVECSCNLNMADGAEHCYCDSSTVTITPVTIECAGVPIAAHVLLHIQL